MESSDKMLWIGVTDRDNEGTFKYLNNNQTVKMHVSQGETFLYHFKNDQPNGGIRKNCVHCAPLIQQVREMDRNALNDAPCGTVTNLWGENVDFHGLCEIEM